ncbi:MAG TPA: BON domain-containing protein [Xanthomonadaceae bacterium]|nr:BON domain-containing protein [Xanthomonadaceae bacterium]
MQHDQTGASVTNDLKATASDMLRLGSRWAHSALDWLDERRHDMAHRSDRDFGSRDRARSAAYPGPDDVARDEGGREQLHRRYGGRREGRSDRDIQSDYSGGGYDQVAGYRGSDDWYRRGGGYGEYAQSRTRSPDDDSLRGDYQAGGYSGAGYGYGASGAGGVGFGAPGYGAGLGYGAGNQDYDRGPMRDESRGFGGYNYNRGFDADMGESDFGTSSRQGRHGQEGYGARGLYGEGSGRARGSAGQGYGAQGYQARNQDYRAQGYGYGSQAGLEDSEAARGGRSYRGLGPRNYTRSDERIREDLNERLTDAHDIDASGVSVEVSNGVVTLTGSVDERWMKHRAEDIADACSGVRDVRNQIQVSQSRSGSGASAGYATGSSGMGGSGGMDTSASGYEGSSQQTTGTSGYGTSGTTGTGTGSTGARNATGGSTTTASGQHGASGSTTHGSSTSGSTGHNA